MSVKIKQVSSPKELKEFVEFGISHYKDNRYHVPKLVRDELSILDPDTNPAFEFCEAAYFLAYRENKIVGRIAAIINHRANDTWNQANARFGFVEFINDNAVVDALFASAENWAKEKGMMMIQGPMGFTDLDLKGMLVEGFDQQGTATTIYNYAYYRKQLERIGFIKDQDWKEYKILIPEQIAKVHQEIATKVREKYGLRTKKCKTEKELRSYVPQIFEALNQSYAVLYGYSELSPKQIDFYAEKYIPSLNLDFVTLVIREEDNKVVAVAITVPSLSRALKRAKGSLFPFGWAYILRALKSKSNHTVDLCILGVIPEYQNKGINALVFEDLCKEYNKYGIRYAESGPELEVNTAVQLQWNYFEKEHHKTRRAYIKRLS